MRHRDQGRASPLIDPAPRRAGLLLLAILLFPHPAGAAHLDFDAAGMPPLRAACGGSIDDWAALRALDDPRDGSVRSLGARLESCLLLPGGPLRDGILSARVTSEDGASGFAARYRGPGDYLAIGVDLAAGRAWVRQHESGNRVLLGGAAFDPLPDGRHRVMAALTGSRASVFVDGRLVCDIGGVPPAEGHVALFADREALTEFDDVDVLALGRDEDILLDPLSPEPVLAGRSLDLALRCLSLSADAGSEGCSFELSGGTLPPGLTLRADGHIVGRPLQPGQHDIEVKVRAGRRSSKLPVRLRVRAVEWPRFPFDTVARVERSLAVLYAPDDIGSTVTLKGLGQPDTILFRLHRDHPQLKITLTACPANRYLGAGRILSAWPEAARLWRMLALDPAFDWIELGGHGYTHSPDGDVDLDHHEFSVDQSGCNIDHSRLGESGYCRRRLAAARDEFRAAGIPDDEVVVMRFPGLADSPEALRAAAEAGFEAVLSGRHPDEAGREWWISHPGGEILDIENSSLAWVFSRSADLESRLADGRLPPESLESDPAFVAEVERGARYVDRVWSQGGILSLFDHWWETFAEFGGVRPRYRVLDAVLRRIESRYGPSAWYPRGRDLALWLEARRRSTVTWRSDHDGLRVIVEPPGRWKERGLTGLQAASLRVQLPPGYAGVSRVDISAGGSAFKPLEPSQWWVDGSGVAVTFPLRQRTQLWLHPPELAAGPAGD